MIPEKEYWDFTLASRSLIFKDIGKQCGRREIYYPYSMASIRVIEASFPLVSYSSWARILRLYS